MRGATFHAAWRVALVVGVILSLVNQGQAMMTDWTAPWMWLRIAFNFLVPFVVASLGFLTACRVPPEAA